DVAGDVPVHLEIKEKVGARRVKRRIPLPIHPEELIRLPLEHPEWLRIVDAWLPQPWRHLLPLWPVIELRYRRLRFVLPGAVDAFCLDTRIRGERFHSRLLVPAPTRDLGFGVFEQKGPSVEAHPVLRTIPRFGGRRQACSKYSMIASQALGEDLN
ncbi:MAG: hypothetical protein KDL10_06615, partial [Kiritimatiellae bacterium]|nr:hypothetical protein [Kiritimatiellia bacterium]